MTKRKILTSFVSVAALGLGLGLSAVSTATGQTLKIALSSEPTAADPHYHQLTPNVTLAHHIFDSLVKLDINLKPQPNLAISWSTRDDNTWVFKLRKGVTFSNGAPFTADDVIFSFCRVLNNETAVSASFTDSASNFKKVEKEGDDTVVITTERVEPLMPEELAQLPIISSQIVKFDKLNFDPKNGCGLKSPWPTVSQFNDGSFTFGTGPYKLKSYVKGNPIILERNETYWGEKPYWKEVSLIPVPQSGPRMAGLLSGDYDLIEGAAARDIERIRNDSKFSFTIKPSTRVIYLQLDMRDNSPQIKSDKGNPFQDQRVRLAMSKAINRKAIVDRIMAGAATPANQFLPDGMFGTIEKPDILDYDPAKAKELLKEAGYPNGFTVTLSATNDRYINDAQVAQALAQMLTQVGIKTEVDAMTRSVFFSKRAKQEFSLAMGGWSSERGEASSFLRQWPMTYDKDGGLGLSNYGRWSNAAYDKIMKQAIVTVDPSARAKLLQEAGKLNLEQMPFIPVHFESTIWAFRKGISYEGRSDQYTFAMGVKPAN